MKNLKKLLIVLLLLFALFKTYESYTYQQKVETLTTQVFDLAEKNLENIFK